MVSSSQSRDVLDLPGEVVYPESDGLPMAENTKQYAWIVLLAENLDAIVEGFVAADLFWYPVEGHPEIRVAPDVLVVPSRPKGHRPSYQQWREDGVAPTLVVEVLSPSNTLREMIAKAQFYERHGVSEFLLIDPEAEKGWGYVRGADGSFKEIPDINGWTSPSLDVRFVRDDEGLHVFGPDGERFERMAVHKARAEQEAARAEQEAARAEQEAARAEQEAARAERLAAKLAELGIDAAAL